LGRSCYFPVQQLKQLDSNPLSNMLWFSGFTESSHQDWAMLHQEIVNPVNASPSTVIESELGILLPDLYKNILDNPHSQKNADSSIYYLTTDPQQLIELNKAYKMKADDLSDIDDGSFFGRLKRIMLHGSKKRIVAQRKKHYREWVEPQKFVIGDDGGEELFYIYLNKPKCPVYAYELETGNSFYRFDLMSQYVNDIDALEEV
jgi:hypothetical protein